MVLKFFTVTLLILSPILLKSMQESFLFSSKTILNSSLRS